MDIFGLNHEIGALKHLLLHFQFPLDLVPKNHMVMSDVEFFFWNGLTSTQEVLVPHCGARELGLSPTTPV